MTNQQFTIARSGRRVSVYPNPLHSPEITQQIQALLPKSEGWEHFTYAAGQVAHNAAAARELAERATIRLTGEPRK